MAVLKKISKVTPICPFCDDTDVIDKGASTTKPSFYNRWQCNGCELTFETYKTNDKDYYTYLSAQNKYLSFDEWKIWALEYYKKEVYSAKTRLSAKIVRFQLLTKDMKYAGVLEAIKKVK